MDDECLSKLSTSIHTLTPTLTPVIYSYLTQKIMPTLLLFLLLLHLLGCFTFSSTHHRHHRRHQTLFKKKPTKTLLSFLKNLFSSTNYHPHISHPIPPSIPSPSSSTRSLRVTPLSPDHSTTTATSTFYIHPCPLCGEILPTPSLLDHHRATKHFISDLLDGSDILRIIFRTGWPDPSVAKAPILNRILKIHHTPNALSRFEQYRDMIKSRAAASGGRSYERCAADGNELLRFYSTTFICSLDGGGACGHPYCGACGIVRSGFSRKVEDGIATQATGWRAHAAVPEDLEEEFSFLKIKRAMLVCRVIAGRVGLGGGKDDPGFDSVERGVGGELLVFDPMAVLPCFVVVYTV